MCFKKKHTFEYRFNETYRILQKYPDRIPVICEKNEKSKQTPYIDKNKYLLPYDLTVSQFIYLIRKRLSIQSNEAIFLFINGHIPPSTCYISEMYDLYKDADGFLYTIYSYENVFGKTNQ
jgi:GABA(A) receptor-associated protein